MGTVLFAWELGGGLGHVGPMRVLAEELTRSGHQCVFAIKDVIAGREVLSGLGSILQAPIMSKPRTAELAFGVGTFGDILAVRGFSDPRLLGPATDAWSDLFELIRPDIIIADFSPTTLVAAYARIPVVTVGYGFYLPPNQLPHFPAFRNGVPPVLSEHSIVASIQDVLLKRGRTGPKTLTALFRVEHSQIYSLPELDPYGIYRLTPGFGPIEPMPDPTPVPKEQRVFAYLAPDYPRMIDVLVGLGDLGCVVEVFFRGAETTLSHFAARRGLVVHPKMPGLSEVIRRASLVISHGGSGVAHAALLGARPQFLLPMHNEGHGTAIMLETIGAGRRLAAELGSRAVKEIIKGGLSNPAFATAARDAAKEARCHYHPRLCRERLVDACNGLLYASRGKSAKRF